jgi:type IV secretion system protein VirB9
MKILACTLALALICASAASGQVRPQATEGDPRLQTVDYVANQVVLLETAPGYQLTVELAPDEQIENVAVGESGAWQVTANRRGDRLFIKALPGGVATNMTVITNARLYAMELVPLYAPTAEMPYIVRFRYPDPNPGAEMPTPSALEQGRYRITGDRRLRPAAISDDGQRTYIEWSADVSIPAVYSVDDSGAESLVNGMMRAGLFVIDAVIPRLAFRIDRRVAHAVRASPAKER